MVFPATMMSLAARKRACCNNRTGMFLSSLWSVITVLGAGYCMVVSLQALAEGPLICSSQGNSTANCQFSLGNISDFHAESFNLQWFFNDSCAPPGDFRPPTASNITMARNGWDYSTYFSSKENKHRIIHFTVFLGLLLVGILEVLFGLSQIVIGFLGCLCGVSKRRSRVV